LVAVCWNFKGLERGVGEESEIMLETI
jgi:hypothetical protein